jgi:hypothetical protein
VCRRGQSSEFVVARIAHRSPRRHTAGQRTIPSTFRGCEFFVGCDQRSKKNGRCAGAGNRCRSSPPGLLTDLRAGTPRFSFGPLVTPYKTAVIYAAQ